MRSVTLPDSDFGRLRIADSGDGISNSPEGPLHVIDKVPSQLPLAEHDARKAGPVFDWLMSGSRASFSDTSETYRCF